MTPADDPDQPTALDADALPDPDQQTPPPPFTRRTVLAAGVPAAAALLGMTAATAPRPAFLGDPMGDQQLTDALAPHLRRHRRVAVALLDGERAPRFAGFGADQSTEFEIGSISKTFTGALLAEAVEYGEVTLETTVA